jgi:AcrR family transcriptional regulator
MSAALEVFASQGYSKASLADIAAKVGIRRPSLLYHFESKQALYEAVTAWVFASLASAIEEALSREGGYEERFEAVLQGYTALLREHPSFSRLLLREILDEAGQGREILLNQIIALTDAAEEFVRNNGPDRGDLPVRTIILQFVTGELVANALGELREPLWKDADGKSAQLIRRLLLRGGDHGITKANRKRVKSD